MHKLRGRAGLAVNDARWMVVTVDPGRPLDTYSLVISPLMRTACCRADLRMESIEVREEKLSAEDKAVSVENVEMEDGKAIGR